jgi:hypothetical protein
VAHTAVVASARLTRPQTGSEERGKDGRHVGYRSVIHRDESRPAHRKVLYAGCNDPPEQTRQPVRDMTYDFHVVPLRP